MDSKRLLIMIGLIVAVILIINESRFIIWGPFGVPEQPNRPNCGENRYNYNLKITSKTDFLNAINDFKDITQEQEGFRIAQYFKYPPEYSLDDITIRTSGSLLFRQKIYIIKIKQCPDLILEMSENGYTSLRGCCGI
ncbi:hypothetical protein FJY84_08235 [Candidatus Bathyarchaeota archaeon]|nr:hypothetical protein [Candidatus Bathyarchaeota archaeon]